MANWVENELIITGLKGDREAFLSDAAGSNAAGEEIPISFAALLPIPEDAPDPVQWAWDNWGTKADVWEWIGLERLPDSVVASFATAWASPTALIQTVSRRYPTLIFDLKFYDADGGHSGSATVKNGEMELVESSEDTEGNEASVP